MQQPAVLSTRPDVIAKAKAVKIAVFDVDGVMTDGSILYSDTGGEIKAFNSMDGLGLKALKMHNIHTAIITARSSEIVTRRARELSIEYVLQGQSDKRSSLTDLIKQLSFQPEEVAYLGDDLQDLPALTLAGLSGTVANGHPFVKEQVDFITNSTGGKGAVREFCEFILQAQGQLTSWYNSYLISN